MAAPMVGHLIAAVNGFLASGKYHEALAVIKGLRNGAIYGIKIRAPHALVMTFLFGRGSVLDKLRSILRAVYIHSSNLASFVFLYKALLAVMRLIEGKYKDIHPAIAGFIGGYLIWGENNKVNSQINMYLLSRIIFGFVRLAVKKNVAKEPKKDPFPFYAAVVWAIVMWQFETFQDVLQPSLQASMTYLYHDSNVWHNLKDFLIYNK